MDVYLCCGDTEEEEFGGEISGGLGKEVSTGPERVAQVRACGLAAALRSLNADLDGGMTRSNSPNTIAARFSRMSATEGSSPFRYNEYLLEESRSAPRWFS